MIHKVGDPDPTPDEVETGCPAETDINGYIWACCWDSPHDGDHVTGNGDIVLHVWPQDGAAANVAATEHLTRETECLMPGGVNGHWSACFAPQCSNPRRTRMVSEWLAL